LILETKNNPCRILASNPSHPPSKGGASKSLYNGNAETYMNIGEAIGRALVDLSTDVSEPPVKVIK
jgi:hypothetical protein